MAIIVTEKIRLENLNNIDAEAFAIGTMSTGFYW
jgi:hypothetical protein